MAKKSWSELTSRQRMLVIVGSLIELVLTTVALQDLRSRPREAVRGPKFVWSLVCFVQPIGPILYLAIGRRSAGS